MHSSKTCIFIGRPGSGKGTQSKHLIEKLQTVEPKKLVLYVETGQLFREFMTGTGHTHDLVRQVMLEGGRIADSLAIWFWSNALINKFTGEEHLVFDGAPRSLLESQVMTTAMKFYQRERPAIVFLNVSREWSTAPLKERGREDDQDEKIANR